MKTICTSSEAEKNAKPAIPDKQTKPVQKKPYEPPQMEILVLNPKEDILNASVPTGSGDVGTEFGDNKTGQDTFGDVRS